MVEARQAKVDSEYRNKATHLDVKYCNHPADASTPGPVAMALKQYPRVKGLVVGHFGEFSSDLEELLDLVAELSAFAYAETFGVPVGHATSASSWYTRRRWGMTAVRANARTKIAARAHVLGRTSSHRRRRTGQHTWGAVYERWDTTTMGGAGLD